MFPVIVLTPCEELEAVIDHLNYLITIGTFDGLSPEHWQDLDTLMRLCPALVNDNRLAAILALRPSKTP